MTLRIAVSGGSIGGVTAALWLRDAGHEVDVFERSPGRLEGRGAGIVLHESTLRYLVEQQGVRVESVSEGARALQYLSPTGEIVYTEPTSLRFTSWNTLHFGLLAALSEDRYHLGHAVAGFEQDADGVLVEVEGVGRFRYDLLVCAEGISSSSRKLLLPDVAPVYSGYVGWRGTVHPEMLSDATRRSLHDLIVYTVPPFNQALSYPIPDVADGSGRTRSAFNWVWYRNVEEGADLDKMMTDRSGTRRPLSLGPGTVRDDVIEQLRAAAPTLPPQLAELVVRTEEPFVQLIVDLEVPQMVFGRVCLIGDAAFAARPHAAAGTAKAAEDGWALARALDDPIHDVDAALAAWETEQLELGRLVVGRSREMGERSQVTCTWYPEDQGLRFGLRAAHH